MTVVMDSSLSTIYSNSRLTYMMPIGLSLTRFSVQRSGAEPQLAADQRGDGCASTDHAVERLSQDRRPDRLPVV